MPLPMIAVDFGAQPPGPIAVERTLRACSLGASVGRCVDARTRPLSNLGARARITWLDAEHRGVLVEVQANGGVGTEAELQRLEFQPEDPQLTRWDAIGLAIGTLVPRPSASGPGSPEGGEGAEPPSAEVPRSDSADPSLWLDLLASYGTGLGDGSAASGVQLAGAYRLGTLPLVSVVTLDSRRALSHGVSAVWTELGVGFGAILAARGLRLRGAAQLLAQSFEASAYSSSASQWDRGTQDTLGLAFSGGISWPSEGRGALSLGARWVSLRHPTSVWVVGQPTVVNPESVVTGYIGLEVGF